MMQEFPDEHDLYGQPRKRKLSKSEYLAEMNGHLPKKRVDADFDRYHSWCKEHGFPLRKAEFAEKYPRAYRVITRGLYDRQIITWKQYVARRRRNQ